MSRWQTVSVKHMDGSVETFQKYISDTEKVEQFIVGSKGCCFDGDTFWLCHDVGNAYLVSYSDTSDIGTITQAFSRETWTVHRHNGSLWTADVYHGPSYEWREDVLETLPYWVEVGGDWDRNV